MLFRATPTKKAKASGRKAAKRAGKARKRALKRASKVGATSQERAAEFAERAGAVSHDVADDIAERLRKSEALAKAQATGAVLAGRARDKWHDAELDDRMSEFAERVRESEAARRTAERTRAMSDASLGAVGHWLTGSKGGKEVSRRMGLQRKRRWPVLLATLTGVAGGVALSKWRETSGGLPPRDELMDTAEHLASPTSATGTVLVDTIRTSLSSDPRTAELTELDINVAEGTVFVRGSVPADMDQAAVRDVIASVPGVRDVDLQLAATT